MMRLLNVYSLAFEDFRPPSVPKYAIASHRWHADSEVTLGDMKKRRRTESDGFRKIMSFCNFVKRHVRDVEWLWIDTCCIDQKNFVEVHEAVNTMFKWYQNAAVCLAYLADVSTPSTSDSANDFKTSEWFRRGWTLQELLAPKLVVFLSREWEVVGHKGGGEEGTRGILAQSPGPSLVREIAATTQIPEDVLKCYNRSSQYTVDDKMRWRRNRETTKPEDLAYCMLGILDIHISLIYGEGEENAAERVRKKIEKRLQTRANMRELVSAACSSEALEQSSGHPRPTDRKDFSEIVIMARLAGLQSPYEAVETPQVRHKYFLDGEGLSKHVVRKYFRSLDKPQAQLRCANHEDREGYLIEGPLLTEENLTLLRQQSRDHEMMRRVENCLINCH